jgi:glycosyltransferase involved in cell wall biosynthesis
MVNIAKHLRSLGIDPAIRLTHEPINYKEYDLLHFFNITRPADIIYHIKRTVTPFVASPNLVLYSEYDKKFRKGLSGLTLRLFPDNCIEYIKVLGRWLNGTDKLKSISYLWRGQHKSIRHILKKAAFVLPSSKMENAKLSEIFRVAPDYRIIPNGVDPDLFVYDETIQKDEQMILSVARIEGIKNQLNLIKALNDSEFKVLIIGSCASNQQSYYDLCKKAAAPNIQFLGQLPQKELIQYYQKAKVHILPSWFETCGLSTLEAAVMGCNVVVTEKGYTREYFGDHALYCDPSSPESILKAARKATAKRQDYLLRYKILRDYTWQNAAFLTSQVYNQMIRKTWD